MFKLKSYSIWMLTLSVLLGTFSDSPAFGDTPESPEVQAMIARGVKYLEENFGKSGGQHENELGAACICALACYKATGNPQHPLVTKAVAQIRTELQKGMTYSGHANYSLGLAMIFLGELDLEAYRTEIEAMLQEIYKRQMPYGAWSYPNDPLGDVSQTQYAVLGMWLAHRQGINVDQQVLERVCNWLLRVQEPSGVFPYKGEDPGHFNRIEQQVQSSASMCAAGVGSLYVCGELLGFIDDPKVMKMRMRLPQAIQVVRDKKDGSIAKIVDRTIWQKAVSDGNTWMGQNGKVENFDGYHKEGYQQYYYMYSVERYWAFRELAEGIDTNEPAWYNAGVAYMRTNQAANGSWQSTRGVANGPVIDTGFAVMFLLRSSKKTITRLVVEAGILSGGKGLKADLSTAKVDDRGQVVTADDTQGVSGLLAMLEDPKAPQSEYISDVPQDIKLSSDPATRQAELTRFRRMLINGPFQGRLTTAKLLGTVRDLDSAPVLIFALSDSDWRVATAARDSLRFMSRKPEGFGFVIESGKAPEKSAWQKAQRDWTNWLLSVRPDAELIE
ncbi:MAG: prenyltransferase/squalene oxidase repeat-containing protein [Planctomycetota bacterium]